MAGFENLGTPKGLPYAWPAGDDQFGQAYNQSLDVLDDYSADQFATDRANTTGLTYAYRGGTVVVSGAMARVGGGTIALTPNAVNYVERTAAGVVSASTISFSSSKLPMAKVTTDGTSITAVEDWRIFGPTDTPDGSEVVTEHGIGDHSDVQIGALATGHFLRFNGSAWINAVPRANDIGPGTFKPGAFTFPGALAVVGLLTLSAGAAIAGPIDLDDTTIITWNADTNLYRSGLNSLKTDDAFTVAGLLTLQAGLTVSAGLAQFKDLELDDQDGTPVADRRLRTIDGLIRVADTSNVEGRHLSRLSLEPITNSEVAVGAGIAYAKLTLTGSVVDADLAASGITTRSKLPSAIAYEDEANTFSTQQVIGTVTGLPGTGAILAVQTGLHIGSSYTAPPVGGIRTEGSIFGEADFLRDGAAGTNRAYVWRTAESTRWALLANTTAESGANAGSDFELFRYSDAGSFIGTVFTATRSSGAVSFGANPVSMGALTATTIEANGRIRNTSVSSPSPFTQARITLYDDTVNWGYFGYGTDAFMRVVFSQTAIPQPLLFGTSSATDNTGTFTEVARLTTAAISPATAGLLTLGTTSLPWGASFFNGNMLIGTGTPATGSPRLDVVGGLPVMVGSDGAVDPSFVLGARHKTAAEEVLTVIRTFNDATNADINYGGGWAFGNAATKHQFFTAATTTTLTGTLAADLMGVGTASLFWARGAMKSVTYESTQVTGTAPFTIASTTLVTNLNADLLDGSHASAFSLSVHTHPESDIVDGTILARLAAAETITGAWTFDNTLTMAATRLLLTAASAAGGAGFRLPHGAAPTTPTNGDLWTTTGGLFARINGATKGPFLDGTIALNDLSDVIITTPASAQVLRYNGTDWVNAALAWTDVSKTGSSLADLATRSAGDLSSGNLPYARMPTGTGTWDADATLRLANGSVTAPAFSFSGDTNTGVYSSDVDEVSIALAANQSVIFDDTRTVGFAMRPVVVIQNPIDTTDVPPVLMFKRSAAHGSVATIGVIRWFGRDSTPSDQEYGAIYVTSFDNTAGSEDSKMEFQTVIAGTLTTRMAIGAGLEVGAPTGGDKGVGTINVAADIYKNNSAYNNPDYVFELAYRGWAERRPDHYRIRSLPEIEEYTKQWHHLPGTHPWRPMGMFDRGDWAQEKIEEGFLHLFSHERRIAELERRLAA